MRPYLILIFFLGCGVLLLAGAGGALAANAVSAPVKEVVITLYQGQNSEIMDDLGGLPKLRENLVKLFGYSRYQRIGTDMAYPHSYSPVTAWPNKLFSLTVYAVNPASPRYEFELKLEDQSVLKGSFIPKPGVPIIIKGPLYGEGQLILVVDAAKL
jgi:hypothetical protein